MSYNVKKIDGNPRPLPVAEDASAPEKPKEKPEKKYPEPEQKDLSEFKRSYYLPWRYAWDAFDGCDKSDRFLPQGCGGKFGRWTKTCEIWAKRQHNTPNLLICAGITYKWYLGGANIYIGSLAGYSGIWMDAVGKEGIIKLEICYRGGTKYTFEVSADSAQKLYIPFTSFRREINNHPTGERYYIDPQDDQIELQIIAIGKKPTSQVDFYIKGFNLG